MKRRLSRDAIVLLALFVVLGALAAAGAWARARNQEGADTFVPLSTHSARDSGTQALHEWFGSLGYTTRQLEDDPLNCPTTRAFSLC